MLKINENYEINRNILKFDFIQNSPLKIIKMNTAEPQIFINTPKKDSVVPLLHS